MYTRDLEFFKDQNKSVSDGADDDQEREEPCAQIPDVGASHQRCETENVTI
mgnify:CR=1 FL=1